MRTGWQIVVAGRGFDPTAFLESSIIQPCSEWDCEVEESGNRWIERGIEFTDWHQGPYPLDMATEAMDYIHSHFNEFRELCTLPGIDKRELNFFDTLDGHGGSFDFFAPWIKALAELQFQISICFLPPQISSTDEKARQT